jgi:hypothetical protein
MPVGVELVGVRFARVSAELKAADPKLQRKMLRGLRHSSEPVKQAMMNAAGDLTFKGMGSGARIGWARALHKRARTVRSLFMPGYSQSAEASVPWKSRAKGGQGGIGLRSSIANSLVLSVSGGGASPAIKIRAVPGRMPGRNTGSLPAAVDKGYWRHPVMGNRKVWAGQAANPPGWFTKTGPKHFTEVQTAMGKVIDQFTVETARSLH